MGVHPDGSTGAGGSRLGVIEGPTGRRRRMKAERARIPAESLVTAASVADVAQRHGLHLDRGTLGNWTGRAFRGLARPHWGHAPSPPRLPPARQGPGGAVGARPQAASEAGSAAAAAMNFSASSAAMQPIPAEVTAWR